MNNNYNGRGNRMPTRWNPNNIPNIVKVQNGSVLAGFESNDVDQVSSTLLYDGGEDPEGQWCIQKVDSTTGVSIRFATIKNNSTYTNYTDAWTDRASLNYDLFSVAF
jgi:arabinogalactan endo-1,4-beta-galactosidase